MVILHGTNLQFLQFYKTPLFIVPIFPGTDPGGGARVPWPPPPHFLKV